MTAAFRYWRPREKIPATDSSRWRRFIERGAVLVFLAFVPQLLGAVPAPADEAGAAVFKKNCVICHTVEAGKNKIGPSLFGVVGRKAGTVPGFAYSAANKNSGAIWDEATLDTYLTAPQKFMPGTKMAFAGLKKPEERKALIEYLEEQH